MTRRSAVFVVAALATLTVVAPARAEVLDLGRFEYHWRDVEAGFTPDVPALGTDPHDGTFLYFNDDSDLPLPTTGSSFCFAFLKHMRAAFDPLLGLVITQPLTWTIMRVERATCSATNKDLVVKSFENDYLATFTIAVTNELPSLAPAAVLEHSIAVDQQEYELDVSHAYVDDKDPLTYTFLPITGCQGVSLETLSNGKAKLVNDSTGVEKTCVVSFNVHDGLEAVQGAATVHYTSLPVAPTLSDPTDQTVTSGGTASFTVGVTGNPDPTVTWEVSTDGATWEPIANDPAATPSANGRTLWVVGSATNSGYKYRATATNSQGTVTSQAATLILQCSVNEHVSNHACLACPPGSTRPGGDLATGPDTSCTETICSANEHVSNHACVACPPGSTRPEGDLATGLDTSCTEIVCSKDHHVSNHACVACAPGSTRPGGDLATGADTSCTATVCGENQYVSNHACVDCAPGGTRPAGDLATGPNTACANDVCGENEYVSSHVCTPCPLGSTRPSGDLASGPDTVCAPNVCAEDQYVASHACVDCAPGSTRPAGDQATGPDTACAPITCAENQYVSNHACVDCAPGGTRPAGDLATGPNTACANDVCGENEYVSSHVCKPCAPGSTRPAGDVATGPDTACAPITCAENQYVSNHACVDCAPGGTRPAGDLATGPNTACTNAVCANDEYVSSHVCTPCAPGSTRPAGDVAAGPDTACAPTVCTENHFVSSHVCTPCPSGSTRPAGDVATGDDTACTASPVEDDGTTPPPVTDGSCAVAAPGASTTAAGFGALGALVLVGVGRHRRCGRPRRCR